MATCLNTFLRTHPISLVESLKYISKNVGLLENGVKDELRESLMTFANNDSDKESTIYNLGMDYAKSKSRDVSKIAKLKTVPDQTIAPKPSETDVTSTSTPKTKNQTNKKNEDKPMAEPIQENGPKTPTAIPTHVNDLGNTNPTPLLQKEHTQDQTLTSIGGEIDELDDMEDSQNDLEYTEPDTIHDSMDKTLDLLQKKASQLMKLTNEKISQDLFENDIEDEEEGEKIDFQQILSYSQHMDTEKNDEETPSKEEFQNIIEAAKVKHEEIKNKWIEKKKENAILKRDLGQIKRNIQENEKNKCTKQKDEICPELLKRRMDYFLKESIKTVASKDQQIEALQEETSMKNMQIDRLEKENEKARKMQTDPTTKTKTTSSNNISDTLLPKIEAMIEKQNQQQSEQNKWNRNIATILNEATQKMATIITEMKETNRKATHKLSTPKGTDKTTSDNTHVKYMYKESLDPSHNHSPMTERAPETTTNVSTSKRTDNTPRDDVQSEHMNKEPLGQSTSNENNDITYEKSTFPKTKNQKPEIIIIGDSNINKLESNKLHDQKCVKKFTRYTTEMAKTDPVNVEAPLLVTNVVLLTGLNDSIKASNDVDSIVQNQEKVISNYIRQFPNAMIHVGSVAPTGQKQEILNKKLEMMAKRRNIAFIGNSGLYNWNSEVVRGNMLNGIHYSDTGIKIFAKEIKRSLYQTQRRSQNPPLPESLNEINGRSDMNLMNNKYGPTMNNMNPMNNNNQINYSNQMSHMGHTNNYSSINHSDHFNGNNPSRIDHDSSRRMPTNHETPFDMSHIIMAMQKGLQAFTQNMNC